MTKQSIIIKFDINGFNQKAQSSTPNEIAEYLGNYYKLVASESADNNWRIVKTIGDCVLISAEENNTHEKIKTAHCNIQERFSISTCYRECEFEEVSFEFGSYACLDTLGKDINNLFLADGKTVSV